MVLLGAAYQYGSFPVAPAAIEEAIALHGASVTANQQAFAGAGTVDDHHEAVDRAGTPAGLQALGHPTVRRLVEALDLPESLTASVERFGTDLVAYQHLDYARRYVADVGAVAARERAATGVPALPVTSAYAAGLYKLLAYKDEYEVARLHLDTPARAALTAHIRPRGVHRRSCSSRRC